MDIIDKTRKERQEEAKRMRESLEKGTGAPSRKQKKKRPTKGKGRVKGESNLKDLGDGQLMNKHGVVFSNSEKEAIRQAVNSVKRKQKRILSDTTGKYDAIKIFNLRSDGSYGGILDSLSTSMNQFESREAMTRFLERMNKMRQKGYEYKQIENTKENYINAIAPTFSGVDDAFIQYLKRMSPEEFFLRRGSSIHEDFVYFDSTPRDSDDMYVARMVHSFGWLTVEEQLNNDRGYDKYTGQPITNESIKRKSEKTTKRRVKKVPKK